MDKNEDFKKMIKIWNTSKNIDKFIEANTLLYNLKLFTTQTRQTISNVLGDEYLIFNKESLIQKNKDKLKLIDNA